MCRNFKIDSRQLNRGHGLRTPPDRCVDFVALVERVRQWRLTLAFQLSHGKLADEEVKLETKVRADVQQQFLRAVGQDQATPAALSAYDFLFEYLWNADTRSRLGNLKSHFNCYKEKEKKHATRVL